MPSKENKYDKFSEKLNEILLLVSKHEYDYMTAEEFCSRNTI